MGTEADRHHPHHHLHRRRSVVLRRVSDRLDEASILPAEAGPLLDLALTTPGVPDTFTDEVDLVGALVLRWHTRLLARLDQAIEGPRGDLPGSVVEAWAGAARDQRGVRRLLDEQLATPSSPGLDALLRRAQQAEHARLAQAAGTAGTDAAAGAGLELAARERLAQGLSSSGPYTASGTSWAFVQRLRALVAA